MTLSIKHPNNFLVGREGANCSAIARPPLLHSIQALRGLAALLVVVFHLVKFKVHFEDGSFQYLFGNLPAVTRGFVGVDVFFVISGFVMVYITQSFQRTPGSVLKFLYSRFSRIYPVWWIFAGLAALQLYLTQGMMVRPEYETLVSSQSSYLAKSFFLIPQSAPIVLDIGWTLIYEMYFYLVFAVLLCFSKKSLLPALVAWFVGICAVAIVIPTPEVATSFATLASSPLTLEFLMGAIIGWLVIHGIYIFSNRIGVIGLSAFILFLFHDFGVLAAQPLWGKIVLFGIPTTMLVYGVVNAELKGKFKSPAWANALGDWSYSLYLSHLFVLSALGRIFAKLAEKLPENLSLYVDLGHPSNTAKYLFASVAICACIIFSGLCYRLIEKPLIKLSKNVMNLKGTSLRPLTS